MLKRARTWVTMTKAMTTARPQDASRPQPPHPDLPGSSPPLTLYYIMIYESVASSELVHLKSATCLAQIVTICWIAHSGGVVGGRGSWILVFLKPLHRVSCTLLSFRDFRLIHPSLQLRRVSSFPFLLRSFQIPISHYSFPRPLFWPPESLALQQQPTDERKKNQIPTHLRWGISATGRKKSKNIQLASSKGLGMGYETALSTRSTSFLALSSSFTSVSTLFSLVLRASQRSVQIKTEGWGSGRGSMGSGRVPSQDIRLGACVRVGDGWVEWCGVAWRVQ